MMIRLAVCYVAFVLLISHHSSGDDTSVIPMTSPIKVLVVDGFSNHDWKQTTACVKKRLESTARFTVDVSTTPAIKESPIGICVG